MYSIKIIKPTLLLLFFTTIGYSQSQEINYKDSLSKYIRNDVDKALTLSHSFYNYSVNTNNQENIDLSYSFLALAHAIKNNNDSALHYYYKGLNFVERPERKLLYNNAIAEIYKKKQNYDKALEYYVKCFEYAEKTKDLDIEDLEDAPKKVELAITSLKSEISNPALVLDALEKLYKKQKANENFTLPYTRKELANAYVNNNMPSKALEIINEGITHAKSRNNIEYQYYFLKLKAESYYQKVEYDSALKAINKALKIANQLDNKAFIQSSNYVLAQIYLKQNKPSNSITLIKKVLKDSTNLTSKDLTQYYKLAADSYKALDSLVISNNYLEKFINENSKLSKNNYSTLENIHNIELNNETLEIEEQKKKKNRWTIAFIVAVCVGLFLLIAKNRADKKNQVLFDDLMLKIKASEANNKNLNTSIEHKIDIVETDNKPIKEEATIAIPDNNLIKDEKVEEILLKIKKLEEKHYFLRQDCTLHNMAKKLKTNTTYLSKIFNNHLEKTFSAYLNDMRINYIIVELKNNKRIRAYSTKAISEDLGYKTVDSFSKYFKQATGITPSVYIKKLQKEA